MVAEITAKNFRGLLFCPLRRPIWTS